MDIHTTEKIGSSDMARLIRRAIMRGEFAPDDRLPSERLLAERFGTARGTVRSALARLEKDGTVETRPGSGTYVVGNKPGIMSEIVANASPLELIDARFALEPHSCRLAVLNARPTDFVKIDAVLEEMEQAVSDPVRFSDADTQFHTLLAESTGNSLIIWVVSQINRVRQQEQWSEVRHLTLNEETIRNYNREHRLIVEAIKQREPERAANLMKEHLQTARSSLTTPEVG